MGVRYLGYKARAANSTGDQALGFIAGYSLNLNEPGGPSPMLLTSEPIQPGRNVFTSISLSRHRVAEQGGAVTAGIYRWEAYTPGGGVSVGQPADWTVRNCAFIDNCRTVTYAIVVEGGAATAQISIATV